LPAAVADRCWPVRIRGSHRESGAAQVMIVKPHRALSHVFVPPKLPKSKILIVSALFAGILVAVFIPTPNVAGGGGAKMVLMIFLTVAFKATVEFFWRRPLKKKNEKGNDKPVA
jgi:hypothetical protein